VDSLSSFSVPALVLSWTASVASLVLRTKFVYVWALIRIGWHKQSTTHLFHEEKQHYEGTEVYDGSPVHHPMPPLSVIDKLHGRLGQVKWCANVNTHASNEWREVVWPACKVKTSQHSYIEDQPEEEERVHSYICSTLMRKELSDEINWLERNKVFVYLQRLQCWLRIDSRQECKGNPGWFCWQSW
jgi:hypothetical protein